MLNNLSIIGRLTRDPEIRQTANGNPVGNFTIACDDRPGPNGEKQVVFLNCTIFGKASETLQKWFKKGNLIGVTGRLTQRKYTNRDNVQVTVTECIADRIEFVDSQKDRQQEEGQPDVQTDNVEHIELEDSELPF